MSHVLAICDRQHGDKGRGFTPGVAIDLDGDGEVKTGEAEARLTPFVISGCTSELDALRLDHRQIDSGPYRQRHETAIETARSHPDWWVPYVAQHLNSFAGGRGYGAFFFDRRSRLGKGFAEALAETLTDIVPDNRQVTARPCYDDRVWDETADTWKRHPTNGYCVTESGGRAWLYNPLATIRGIYSGPGNLFGVCSEPMRVQGLIGMTQTSRESLLREVGKAQAQAISRYCASLK